MSEKKILVVDDEADVIAYLSAMLKDAGYEVATANNGQEAMDAVKAGAPALISLDITMPEKSGVRFYREMREDPALKDVPIVIVTGVTNPLAAPGGGGSFEQFISSRKELRPPDAFFEKPIDRDAYLKKIAEILGD